MTSAAHRWQSAAPGGRPGITRRNAALACGWGAASTTSGALHGPV
jgi:hypothetical protein